MRQKAPEELKTRKAVQDAIEANVETSRMVYPSPARLESILKADGIKITRQTLYKAYEQLGIYSINGLWVKDV